jgi:uncharacterized damage-inducible protein DinB
VVDCLGSENYAKAVPGHSSVGAHMRHCLDHFFCFFKGWDAGSPINYDARQRNPGLQNDPEAARAAIHDIVARLEELADQDPRQPLTVQQTPAKDEEPVSLQTTLERELVFLSAHSIHHLALMRLLIEMLDTAKDVGDLGVAYSTVGHRDFFTGLGEGI